MFNAFGEEHVKGNRRKEKKFMNSLFICTFRQILLK